MLSIITASLCRLLLLAAALLLSLSGGVLLYFYTLPVLALFCFAAWPRGRAWSGWSHGTARMATWNDLRRRQLLNRKDGLIIGRATYVNAPPKWRALLCLISPFVGSTHAVRMVLAAFWRGYDNSIIRLNTFTHAVTFAPTGAGKGVCVQIPNLFTYKKSIVVVDPQGTLFKVTGWFREKVLGHKIIKMDPLGFAGPASESDCFNPCDFIDEKSATFIDEIRELVELMVKREANEFQPHFNDWAIIVLCSMLTFICSCEGDPSCRSLVVMRDLVCSKKGFIDAREAMREVSGLVYKMGAMLDIPADKELSSILSTVQRHTAWMDSPPIAASLEKSTWDPRWLRSGKVTVYLILPSDKLSSLSPLLRLWIGSILQVVTREGASEKNPILFMIDEAAHIGKIPKLEDAITLMRAFGIRVWLFFQSVNQLQTCYGDKAQTILDNMSVQQFFGTNAYQSAEHISLRVGDCTILVESINRNRQRSTPTGLARDSQPGSVSTGSGTTIGEAGRRFFRPEELLVLPDNVCLTFFKNMHVIVSELVPYYADPAFKKNRGGRERGVGLAGSVFAVAAVVFSVAVLVGVAGLGVPTPAGHPGSVPMRQNGGMVPPPLNTRAGRVIAPSAIIRRPAPLTPKAAYRPPGGRSPYYFGPERAYYGR